MAEQEEERAELTTFQTKVAYVYLPLPPATSYGHRAELWNPEKWFREVKLRVVSVGDELYIRLEEQETGELFAECPLPSDGSPLTTAVEPVVDSSRYYVLRVVDREDAKKHAFLGLGFRERQESSNFSAALDEYRQYLRRRAEAAAMRQAYDTPAGEEEGGEGNGEAGRPAPRKYALDASQKISLKLPSIGRSNGDAAAGAVKAQGNGLVHVFSLSESTAGVRLAPPPPAGSKTAPSANPGDHGSWAVFSEKQEPADGLLPMRASGELKDEDWGDFQ